MGSTTVSEMSSVNSPRTPCTKPKAKQQYSTHSESLKWRLLDNGYFEDWNGDGRITLILILEGRAENVGVGWLEQNQDRVQVIIARWPVSRYIISYASTPLK